MTPRKLSNVLLKITGLVMTVYLLPTLVFTIIMMPAINIMIIPLLTLSTGICLVVFSKAISALLFAAEEEDMPPRRTFPRSTY